MSEIRLVTHDLIHHLIEELSGATTVYWITAFAMKSGVQLILPELIDAASRKADTKILVGDYLAITQPEALRMLYENLPTAEIRLFKSYGQSFHPKAYLFRNPEQNTLMVGSSNLSKSALTSGVEWNLSVPTAVDAPLFEQAASEFIRMFTHENTIPVNSETIDIYESHYNEQNRAMSLSSAWSKADEIEVMFGTEGQDQTDVIIETDAPYQAVLKPRPAQELALQALEESMEEEYDRALAVLATGLGKTYLAAFFAERFSRVLFVAHREEILYQARDSFLHVHSQKKAGLYNATQKDVDYDFLFASVSTLCQDHHLAKFDPEEFDLIVVDEFHHATAPSYMRVIDYFKPRFLLGITATPHRLDNGDVFGICDGNVAITINFLDAIQKNWLAPFKYYGVYDETDYSQLRWVGSGYAEEDLERVQLREEMAEMIYREWLSKKQTRTIGFCSSVKQAKFLATYFEQQGVRAISLDAKSDPTIRKMARQKLNDGELDVIFTVDLFNEGVDIPKVDTLLFVRPTESLAVFTQQIGRGLRLAEGKDHCVIIDLIGNYRNADLKWRVFNPNKISGEGLTRITESLPNNCEINLDTKVINLVNHMSEKYQRGKEFLLAQDYMIRNELGRRPTYLEFHLNSQIDSSEIKNQYSTYFHMLQASNDLNEREIIVLQRYQDWFIEVERTGMSKSYKMVLLKCMLTRGIYDWFKPFKAIEASACFYDYIWSKKYRRNIDMTEKQQSTFATFNENKIATLIQNMPMKFWSGSSNGLVKFEDKTFWINVEFQDEDLDIIYDWTSQICEYRLHTYFEKKAKKLN